MFKPLTNRSTEKGGEFTLPADGFVQLVPRGEAPNVLEDGSKEGKRIIQVVDDASLESIMSKLLNRSGEEMLIDNEHFSHEPDKSTDANGWQVLDASSLQNRADGLYGDPRWSTDGLKKITGGVLRYVSPEFGTNSLQHLGGNRYRVTELTGLALTNRPGFKKLQKPLTNRDAEVGIDNAPTHTMHKALLAAHLGITESDIDKLDEPTLKNRLSGIKDQAAKAVTLEAEATTLKNREADDFMTRHDKVIPKNEVVRKHVRDTFLANREAAEGIVEGFGESGDGLTEEQRKRAGQQPLFNRETAKGPQGDEVLKNRAIERAAKIKNRATAICEERRNAGRPADFHSAYAQAEAETPV